MSLLSQGGRGTAALVVLLGVTASACGARTEIPVGFFTTVARDGGGGSVDGGSKPDGTVPPLPDGAASNDASCGNPWVVFILSSGAQGQTLFALRSAGKDGHTVPLPAADPSFPWISTDGATLVYTTESGGALHLHHFADGSDTTVATGTGPTGQVVGGFAALAPNGLGLAYSTTQGLVYVPLATGVATLLVPSTAVGALGDAPAFPTFTLDSQNIVFGTRVAIGEVATAGPSGSGQFLLANPEGFVGIDNATLSPDQSTLIAGVACPLGTYALRSYPFAALPLDCASGTIVTTMTSPGPVPFYPTWGPSGLIAYWDAEQDIMLVPAAGGTPTNLTQGLTGGGVTATMPAWAPACTKL